MFSSKQPRKKAISSSSLHYTYGSQKKHQYIKLQGNMLLTLLGWCAQQELITWLRPDQPGARLPCSRCSRCSAPQRLLADSSCTISWVSLPEGVLWPLEWAQLAGQSKNATELIQEQAIASEAQELEDKYPCFLSFQWNNSVLYSLQACRRAPPYWCTFYLLFLPSVTSPLLHCVFWDNLPNNPCLRFCFLGNQN